MQSRLNKCATLLALIIVVRPAESTSVGHTKGSPLIVNEYCNMHPVNISCSGGNQVIVVRKARYGRMQLGRCVRRDLGYLGCSSDVLPLINARCSARRRCSFSLPDPQLYATRPCPVDTTSYLEVTHECLRVAGDDGSRSCHTSEGAMPLADKLGYIELNWDENSGRGHVMTGVCRWMIVADRGQRINLTLYHFGALRSFSSHSRTSSSVGVLGGRGDVTKWRDGACYELATVSEHETNVIKSLTTCTSPAPSSSSSPSSQTTTTDSAAGAVGSERHLYQSTTHSIELRLATVSPAHRRLGRFLIKYEAVSCPDIAAPRGGQVRRTDDDVAIVTCINSNEVWYLTCKGVKWDGQYGNCSHEATESSANSDQRTTLDAFPYGILIVVAVGVALGVLLGGLLLIFVVVYMRRRHRHSCHESGEPVDIASGGTGLSPTGGRIYASPSHLRAVCPSSHHVYCDKYDTAASAHWFDASTNSHLCWNQTVKFLTPSDEELLSSSHDPYAVDRNWTAVTGTEPVTAVSL